MRPVSSGLRVSGIMCVCSPSCRLMWEAPRRSVLRRARLERNQPRWGRERSPWVTTLRRLARHPMRETMQPPSVRARKRAGEIPWRSARTPRLWRMIPPHSARARRRCREALRCLARTLRRGSGVRRLARTLLPPPMRCRSAQTLLRASERCRSASAHFPWPTPPLWVT